MGKERVREAKIQGRIEGERSVGGKQEEGDHSEGKEEDPKIIRDGYAFAHERGREKEGERGAGDRRGLSPIPAPHAESLLSSTVPLPISHSDEPQPPRQSCRD